MRVDAVSFIYGIYKCPVCKVSHSLNSSCKKDLNSDKLNKKKYGV